MRNPQSKENYKKYSKKHFNNKSIIGNYKTVDVHMSDKKRKARNLNFRRLNPHSLLVKPVKFITTRENFARRFVDISDKDKKIQVSASVENRCNRNFGRSRTEEGSSEPCTRSYRLHFSTEDNVLKRRKNFIGYDRPLNLVKRPKKRERKTRHRSRFSSKSQNQVSSTTPNKVKKSKFVKVNNQLGGILKSLEAARAKSGGYKSFSKRIACPLLKKKDLKSRIRIQRSKYSERISRNSKKEEKYNLKILKNRIDINIFKPKELSIRQISLIQATVRMYLTRKRVQIKQLIFEKENSDFLKITKLQKELKDAKATPIRIYLIDFEDDSSIGYGILDREILADQLDFEIPCITKTEEEQEQSKEKKFRFYSKIFLTSDPSISKSALLVSQNSSLFPLTLTNLNQFIPLALKIRCDTNLLYKLKLILKGSKGVLCVNGKPSAHEIKLSCDLGVAIQGFNLIAPMSLLMEKKILHETGLPVPPCTSPVTSIKMLFAKFAQIIVRNPFIVHYCFRDKNGKERAYINVSFLGIHRGVKEGLKVKLLKEIVETYLAHELVKRIKVVDYYRHGDIVKFEGQRKQRNKDLIFIRDFCSNSGVIQACSPNNQFKPIKKVHITFESQKGARNFISKISTRVETGVSSSPESNSSQFTSSAKSSIQTVVDFKDEFSSVSVNKVNNKAIIKYRHIFTSLSPFEIYTAQDSITSIDIEKILQIIGDTLAENLHYGVFRVVVSIFDNKSFWVEWLNFGLGQIDFLWKKLIGFIIEEKTRERGEDKNYLGVKIKEFDRKNRMLRSDIRNVRRTNLFMTDDEQVYPFTVTVLPRIHIPKNESSLGFNLEAFRKLLSLKDILFDGDKGVIILPNPPIKPRFIGLVIVAKSEKMSFDFLESFLTLLLGDYGMGSKDIDLFWKDQPMYDAIKVRLKVLKKAILRRNKDRRSLFTSRNNSRITNELQTRGVIKIQS